MQILFFLKHFYIKYLAFFLTIELDIRTVFIPSFSTRENSQMKCFGSVNIVIKEIFRSELSYIVNVIIKGPD